MAGNFNRVFLMGNLTRDPELRHTPSSMAVANIGLAVNRRFRDSAGNNQEETTFVDCEAWGRTAEVMCQYLAKGRPVFVEGRLKLDQWQDKEGGNRSKLKVVIENFQFVDSRTEGAPGGGGGASGGGGPPAQRSAGSQPARQGTTPAYEPVEDDDIPF
ncbi:MAG: single-stranded DNA-binding protein [Phycisphaerales bacterium]|nr:MAG: single-stranded DNA-binding protein [Phycisphaerales bacterium]